MFNKVLLKGSHESTAYLEVYLHSEVSLRSFKWIYLLEIHCWKWKCCHFLGYIRMLETKLVLNNKSL